MICRKITEWKYTQEFWLFIVEDLNFIRGTWGLLYKVGIGNFDGNSNTLCNNIGEIKANKYWRKDNYKLNYK